ncbi:MAG: glycosyltransferase family 39 protein [Planctomycetaceae bacterium]
MSSASYWSVIALLIAVHVGLGLHTVVSKSVTHDEIWHLPVGILNLTTGTFAHDDLNPPLTRMWAALPAVLCGVRAEEGRDATDVALKFVLGHPDHQRWYVWGRAMNLLLSAATAIILAQWARRWLGDAAALLAVGLYCADPNVLAHASLVTPDTGLTLGFTATLWLLDRWLEDRSWKLAWLLGGVLGLAQATKFTALLLFPVVIALWGLRLFGRRFATRETAGGRWQLPVVLVVSLVPWNIAYLCQGTGGSLAGYQPQSQSLRTVRDLAGPLAKLPLPLPADFVRGVDRQRAVMEQPHPAYLDGVWRITGFRDYYLRTLQYKLPHLTQVLLACGLLAWCARPSIPHRIRRLLLLLVPAGLLLGVASFSPMQLGVRYVLPVLPPLLLLAAAAIRWQAAGSRPQGLTLCVLLLGTGWSLRHHPDHLAYFNEAAGGPMGGRHHLLDSNLDWGQDLGLVREFMNSRDIETIHLVYFGTLPAETQGIRYTLPPGWKPTAGWHAISVNYVMGRPHLLREPDGTSRAADLGEYSWCRQFEPVTNLGGSIDVYHIPEAAAAP